MRVPYLLPLLFILLTISLACTEQNTSLSVAQVDAGDDLLDAGSDLPDVGVDLPSEDITRDRNTPGDDTSWEDLEVEDLPPGLDQRPLNTTCLAPPRPTPASGLRLTQVFENLEFEAAVAMLQAPGDDTRWYILEQAGRVLWFENVPTASSPEVFVDIVGDIPFAGERGLLGMAFHPQFADNGYVFLSYSIFVPEERTLYTRITRVSMDTERHALDMTTEERIFQVAQPFGNHNGGSIAFGPDGYLYAGYGDGGSGGDPQGHGQDLSTLLGTMTRIDVDRPDPERLTPYSIPPDNPFIGQEDVPPEIWAYGLRNPWKFSFDRDNGVLWASDVGQSRYEEVDIIIKGGNYGWNVFEGSECYIGNFDPNPACDTLDAIEPVVEYFHDSRASITGGFVYRGTLIPRLEGAYIYADYSSGRVWAALPDLQSATGYTAEVLFDSAGFNISSFGEDTDGEIYIIRYNEDGGALYRLEPEPEVLPDTFPQRLSQTGCVQADEPWQPADGVLPYALNVPFWSDNADKERWFAIPEGTQIESQMDGSLVLPPGAVTLKHFRVDEKLIETRLFVRHEDGNWAGYTYRWDEAQTDAILLLQDERRDLGDQIWRYPSRAACLQCHNDAIGGTIGLELAQLDRPMTYFNGRTADQVTTLRHIGILASEPDASMWEPLLARNAEASLDSRARAYLHANCAYCHFPGGPGQSDLDLRYQSSLQEMAACEVIPQEGDLGIEGVTLLEPGDPARSMLLERMRRFDSNRMPSTLSTVTDEEGFDLIEAWILSLETCADAP